MIHHITHRDQLKAITSDCTISMDVSVIEMRPVFTSMRSVQERLRFLKQTVRLKEIRK